MRLTVVGCSGSFPGPDSACSCYLIEADGFRLCLDLGSGALGPLAAYCHPSDLDAVVVSHLHHDHLADLISLCVARVYGPRPTSRRVSVLGPRGLGDRLAAIAGDDVADVLEIEEHDGQRHQLGPLTLTFAPAIHTQPAWCMRVSDGSSHLVYTGDTGPTPALAALASGADVLLAEATYPEGHADSAIHMTGADAGAAAAAAGVGTLILTHLVPGVDWAAIEDAARNTFPGSLLLARPGLMMELPAR